MSTTVARKSLKYIHDDVEYYQHQVDGIRKGARLSSFILADEPGLGKTLEALTVAAIDFELGLARRVLVVSPATLKWNWADEIEKHTNFRYIIVDGTATERQKQIRLFEILEIEILIINYEQVITHLHDLNNLNFDIICYDEAHLIKNPKSKRSKACLALRGKRHIPITGTPMLNQVNELWTLLHRVNPVKYASYYPFVQRYCAFGGYRNKQIIGVKNKAELHAELQSVMIRRLASEVLDLPETQVIQIPVELTELQRKLYNEAEDELQISLPDSPTPMDLENSLVKFLRLKQICGTTACIEGYEDESAKLDEAVRRIVEITHDEPDSPSQAVVVFTQFRPVLACLEKRLAEVGIQCFSIHGDVPKQSRVPTILEWSNYLDPKTKRKAVCIVMLQVAVGVNMTAASKCIFIDKLFVPDLNDQAVRRLRRIGQTKSVQVYELIARKTKEQRIEAILKSKRKLINSLVEENQWKRAIYEALKESD